jgi:hypothetical protein
MKFGGYLPACGLGLLIAGEVGTATAAPGADANSLSDLEQVTVYAPFSNSGDGSTSGVSLGGTTVSSASPPSSTTAAHAQRKKPSFGTTAKPRAPGLALSN